MNFLVQWVEQVIIIALLIGLAELLLPRSNVQNFARLALSLVLALAILQPVFSLLQRAPDINVTFIEQSSFGRQWQEVVEAGEALWAGNQEKITSVYLDKLQERCRLIAEEIHGVERAYVTARIEENARSPNFGIIQELEVILEVRRVAQLRSGLFQSHARDTKPERDISVHATVRAVEPVRVMQQQPGEDVPLSLHGSNNAPGEVDWSLRNPEDARVAAEVRAALLRAFVMLKPETIRVGVIVREGDG